MIAVVAILGLVCVAQTTAILYVLWHFRASGAAEAGRLISLASEAMSHLKAQSLAEKVQADTAKKQQDFQFVYLQEQLAKQQQVAQGTPAVRQPVWVQDEEGNKIDLSDPRYEIVS